MKDFEKLSENVLRESESLIKSISYEKGQLNTKCIKGMDNEGKLCTICLILGMIIINILSTNKIKDKDNIKMLKELHKSIDRCFNKLNL